jgi:hypothetical protein
MLSAATFVVKAEALNPTMNVNLPYAATIGSQQLAPGHYVIREVSHLSNIFGVYKADGSLETYVHAIPTEQLSAASETDLVLRGNGKEFVIDQMRFEGQKNGFQFVNPDSVKARLQERTSIPAASGVKAGGL